MHKHRPFSRRSEAESEKLSEKTHESFREDIVVNDNYKSMTSQSIGHFRDHSVVGLPKARQASIKLIEKSQESFERTLRAIFFTFTTIYQGAKHRSINGWKPFCREEKPTRRIGTLAFLIG